MPFYHPSASISALLVDLSKSVRHSTIWPRHGLRRVTLRTKGQKLHHQEAQLAGVRQEVVEASRQNEAACATLSEQLDYVLNRLQGLEQALATRSPESGASAAAIAEDPAPFSQPPESQCLRLSSLERFSGEYGDCRPFLSLCELQFEFPASAFPSDRAKVAYIISYLSGQAKAWATAEWSCRSAICNSLPLLVETFKTVFQSATPGHEAAKALVALKQGRRSVLDYAIEFRTLAADSGWNQPALVDAFYNGLTEMIKDHLTPLDLPSELDALVALTCQIGK